MPRYAFIGLTCTGSHIATVAMQQLGFSAIEFPFSLSFCNQVEVMTDTSVAYWFRTGRLPRDYTLILTVRGLEDWLDACRVWFTTRPPEGVDEFTEVVRDYLYGGFTFERHRFIRAHDWHIQECHRLAQQWNMPLHIWNVIESPTWDFLCQLTGKPIPDTPFPRVDSTYRTTWQEVVTYLHTHQH